MNICIICLENCINNMNECKDCDIFMCETCLIQWYNKKNKKICPVCKKNIDDYILDNDINNNDIDIILDDDNNIYNYQFNNYIIKICSTLLLLILIYSFFFFIKLLVSL